SAVLLARSSVADGDVSIPNLFFRSPLYRAPGHEARTLAWIALAVFLGWWLRRATAGRGGGSPVRMLFGTTLLLLAVGAVLERWPSPFKSPRFPGAVDLGSGVTAFVSGDGTVEGNGIRGEPGDLELLVRSREPVAQVSLMASGAGRLRVPGRAPLALRPGGATVELSLDTLCELTGRRGARETLARGRLWLAPEGELRLGFRAP